MQVVLLRVNSKIRKGKHCAQATDPTFSSSACSFCSAAPNARLFRLHRARKRYAATATSTANRKRKLIDPMLTPFTISVNIPGVQFASWHRLAFSSARLGSSDATATNWKGVQSAPAPQKAPKTDPMMVGVVAAPLGGAGAGAVTGATPGRLVTGRPTICCASCGAGAGAGAGTATGPAICWNRTISTFSTGSPAQHHFTQGFGMVPGTQCSASCSWTHMQDKCAALKRSHLSCSMPAQSLLL